MNGNEKWAAISGYEGIYEISDRGRVRSKKRIDASGRRRKGALLSVAISRYSLVTLCSDGIRISHLVHRLVAHAFVRGSSKNKNQVNHIDGDRHNNNYSNLEWCNAKHNVLQAYATGLIPKGGNVGVGSRNINSKLDEGKVREIKSLLKTHTHEIIASMYGVTRCCITQISIGNNWGHI